MDLATTILKIYNIKRGKANDKTSLILHTQPCIGTG